MGSETDPHKFASLEALLFIHGEPLVFKKIGAMLNMTPEEARELTSELRDRLAAEDRGLTIVMSDEKAQIVTKGEFSNIAESFVKSELSEELSPASLETLAIIAYFGPISRARIDYQRGVNSTFILRSLLLRGLIERSPDPAHANSFLYKPSFEFVKYIGLTKQEELPNFEKFKTLLHRFESGEDEKNSPGGEAATIS